MNVITLARAMDVLAAEVDPDIQVQTVRALLVVVVRGSCTQKEVETELGSTNASTSRNISYWTEMRFDKKPGMGFIMRLEDPQDRRYKMLTLTKKGQAFIEKIREV